MALAVELHATGLKGMGSKPVDFLFQLFYPEIAHKFGAAWIQARCLSL